MHIYALIFSEIELLVLWNIDLNLDVFHYHTVLIHKNYSFIWDFKYKII